MNEMISIALAQINPTVGDIEGNSILIQSARAQAHELGAHAIIFGELTKKKI